MEDLIHLFGEIKFKVGNRCLSQSNQATFAKWEIIDLDFNFLKQCL